jgi:GPH family glycoside/pentoside/hexuronide:cation symporter
MLFFSFALCYLALVINSSLSIHYLTLYAGVSKSTNLSLFQLAFYSMGIVGVGFWWYVSRFVEKRHVYLMGLSALAALMLSSYLLVGQGHLFGAGNVVALAIGHGLGGFFGSIVWFVPGSMTADVTDDDELASGQRREGTFFGLLSFGQQMAAGAAILVTGVLVDWFARLQPGSAIQPVFTSQRIGMMFGLLPAALLVIAAALSYGYALTRARVATIQAMIGQR